MSHCLYCGKTEPLNSGRQVQDGWACSRCANVGMINTQVGHATTNLFNGAHMVGVLGNLQYDGSETNALQRAVNSPQHDSGAEDMGPWLRSTSPDNSGHKYRGGIHPQPGRPCLWHRKTYWQGKWPLSNFALVWEPLSSKPLGRTEQASGNGILRGSGL